ncbi:hypothetical protein VNO80_10089 [Phaseolus coccineus]|uniref:Uncharacterized protein n=1 Tax=Phaseolus coccineus TaxID=3886 RepID=A0AAN9N7Y6_PHACN
MDADSDVITVHVLCINTKFISYACLFDFHLFLLTLAWLIIIEDRKIPSDCLNPCIPSEVLRISQQFVGSEGITMNFTYAKRMIHAGGCGIKNGFVWLPQEECFMVGKLMEMETDPLQFRI